MKLSELIDEYLNSLTGSEKTAQNYMFCIYHFLDFAGDIDVNYLTSVLIDDYVNYLKDEKKLQRSTIRSYINPVRGTVKLGYVRGYIDLKPEQVKSPRVPRKRGKIMRVMDFRAMLLTARDLADTGDWRDVRNLAMFAFTGDTWCRLGGLMSLTFDRLDLDTLTAVLHEKNDTEHPVQYGEHTVEFMRRWLEVRPPSNGDGAVWVVQQNGIKPMAPRSWQYTCDKLAEAAGVTGPHNPHAIRHMSATEASRRGVAVEVIQKKCGHLSSVTTIDIYLHADEKRLRDATDDVGDVLFGEDEDL
jgi:site-specific recombinase XerD